MRQEVVLLLETKCLEVRLLFSLDVDVPKPLRKTFLVYKNKQEAFKGIYMSKKQTKNLQLQVFFKKSLKREVKAYSQEDLSQRECLDRPCYMYA
jgi:hypothetical protein